MGGCSGRSKELPKRSGWWSWRGAPGLATCRLQVILTQMSTSSPVTHSDLNVEAACRRTRRLSLFEGATWAVMYGFGDTYLPPFAVLLRASNQVMAYLGAAPIVIGALAQLAGAWLSDRTGRRKWILITTTAIQAFGWLGMSILALSAAAQPIPWLLALATILAWSSAFGSAAFASWMGDVTRPADRGRYFGLRNGVLTLTTVIAMVVAAGWLSLFRDWWQRPLLGFATLFFLAACARATSSWLFTKHYEPPYQRAPDAYFSFWDYLRRAPRSNFTRFSIAVAAMNGAVNVAGPFFSVYMLRDLHWTYAQFMLNTVVQLLSQFLVYRWWGAVCDRHGARVVIKATSVLLPVLPVLWAVFTGFGPLMLVQALSGFVWAGFNLASANFLYDAVTPPKRARVASYNGLLNAMATLIGANVIGATLADAVPTEWTLGPWRMHLLSPLPVVFVVSGVLRVLAAVFLVPLFREVRPVEKVSTWTLLARFGSGEPIIAAGAELMQLIPLPRFARLRSPSDALSPAPNRPEESPGRPEDRS